VVFSSMALTTSYLSQAKTPRREDVEPYSSVLIRNARSLFVARRDRGEDMSARPILIDVFLASPSDIYKGNEINRCCDNRQLV
jgi:hypothetical protein